MRSETNCSCPKCGYKFIDVSEGYVIPFDDEEYKKRIERYYSDVQKMRNNDLWCDRHYCELVNGTCDYCEKEEEMNKDD